MHIIIVGAGIAGLSAALSLSKYISPPPEITVLELRATPSAIGGAIGLTPNALRVLNHLGVFEVIQRREYGCEVGKIEMFEVNRGTRIGEISFEGLDGKGCGGDGNRFRGRRILRTELVQAMMEVVEKLEKVKVRFGKKVVAIEENENSVEVASEDGEEVEGDLAIGCDGIHSAARTLLVDKERKEVYTGIAAVMGYVELREGQKVDWEDTALCQSQKGSLMCSYFDRGRSRMYAAAIMEMEDVKSREGWVAKGKEQERIKNNIQERYCGKGMQCLDELVASSQEWTLYPVYKLGPGGKWCTRRTMLLGDAAHAMPPQGESAGIAMEDAVLFARCLAAFTEQEADSAFVKYERSRRPRIDEAYNQASFGWNSQRDSGWFKFQLTTYMTSWFLWWTSESRNKRYAEDITTVTTP